MRHRCVPRWDGARGKKQLWHLYVRTWGPFGVNVLYWRKTLRATLLGLFGAAEWFGARGNVPPLPLLVTPLAWHFTTKCAAVKSAESWMSNHFSQLRDHSYVAMKITAKENDANDIFADVSITPATIISAFAIELQWSCCKFLWSVRRQLARYGQSGENVHELVCSSTAIVASASWRGPRVTLHKSAWCQQSNLSLRPWSNICVPR